MQKKKLIGDKKEKRDSVSITAYELKICESHKNIDLLTMQEDIEVNVKLSSVIEMFGQYVLKSKPGKYSNKVLLLNGKIKSEKVGKLTKLSIPCLAGRAGEDFVLLNNKTQERKPYDGNDNSAVYGYNTFCYYNDESGENLFIFVRHGLSGCKTVFEEVMNSMLAIEKRRVHFIVQLSSKSFEDSNKYYPKKLNLITYTEETPSSDIAENLNKSRRKETAREVVLNLESVKYRNIKEWFKSNFGKKIAIDELKKVAISSGLDDAFDNAKVIMKINGVSRTINVSEFEGLIAEYDITDLLEYYENDKKYKKASFDKIVDEYALSFFEGEGE